MKRKLLEVIIVALIEECSTILQHKLPPKLKDTENFILPCSIGNSHSINVLIDSGASIN